MNSVIGYMLISTFDVQREAGLSAAVLGSADEVTGILD